MNTTTKEPKFYDTKGQLTSYALACGYCEKQEQGEKRKTLYREHNTYTVFAFFGEGAYNTIKLCFDTLSEARKAYNKIKL
jgi:hypothetical protein